MFYREVEQMSSLKHSFAATATSPLVPTFLITIWGNIYVVSVATTVLLVLSVFFRSANLLSLASLCFYKNDIFWIQFVSSVRFLCAFKVIVFHCSVVMIAFLSLRLTFMRIRRAPKSSQLLVIRHLFLHQFERRTYVEYVDYHLLMEVSRKQQCVSWRLFILSCITQHLPHFFHHFAIHRLF